MDTLVAPDAALAQPSVRSLELTVYRIPAVGPLRVVGVVDVTRPSRRMRRDLHRTVAKAIARRWDDEQLAVAVHDGGAGGRLLEPLPEGFGRGGAWRLPEPVIRFVAGWRAGSLS